MDILTFSQAKLEQYGTDGDPTPKENIFQTPTGSSESKKGILTWVKEHENFEVPYTRLFI